jgi:hypothetical protein
MSDPIRGFGSVSPRDYCWIDQPSDRDDFRESVVRGTDHGISQVCREPTTVVGSTIWGDATAVSNACRCAKPGTVDDFLCDDRKLAEVEKTCWDVAKKAAWKAVQLFFGARLAKP